MREQFEQFSLQLNARSQQQYVGFAHLFNDVLESRNGLIQNK